MGIITSLGNGVANTRDAIQNSRAGIGPLTLFPTAASQSLPVGEVADMIEDDDLPRTHQLARLAAAQAMADCREAPDAVVMGVTTGGMLTSEYLLKKKSRDPKLFGLHATGSVAGDIANQYRCTGPALTVSTACSSGAAAIKIALELLRSGNFKRVLAGPLGGVGIDPDQAQAPVGELRIEVAVAQLRYAVAHAGRAVLIGVFLMPADILRV